MALTSFDISMLSTSVLPRSAVIAMLYYAGYLTFRGDWMVGYPNAEIEMSFTANLVSRYANNGSDPAFLSMWLIEFRAACADGEEDGVRKKIEEYFAAFSYELQDMGKERFYQTIFHAIFICAGLYAVSEDRGARGRADEVIISGNHIWIFELKVDRSAEEALGQIENKGYAEKYSYLLKPGMKIHKVGISFSSETRIIQEWRSIEECN